MSPDEIGSATDSSGAKNVTMTLGDALKLGRQLHLRGEWQDAETIYRQILAVKPQQQEALHFLGLLAHQTGHPRHALDLLFDALKVDPGYVDAWNNLGNVLTCEGDHAQAESAYRRAIELKPDHSEAHNNLAAVLNLQGRYEEGLDACLRAIDLIGGLTTDARSAGDALAAAGQAEQATDMYLRGLQKKRFEPGYYENLGSSLQRLGRLDDAARVYQRWIEFDPQNPRPRHHLAACSGKEIPRRASNDYVQQVFDRFSRSFDKCLTTLKYAAPGLVVDAAATELPDCGVYDVALDAGCGTGLCGPGLKPLAQRLVGVDLSNGMLEKARARDCYDELVHAELTEFLASQRGAYDLIVSADVLVYFGDLRPVMRAAAGALRPPGCLVFTVEKASPDAAPEGYHLQPHGRYCHTDAYLRHVLAEADLHVRCCREVFLRNEVLDAVQGWLVVAQAAAAPTA